MAEPTTATSNRENCIDLKPLQSLVSDCSLDRLVDWEGLDPDDLIKMDKDGDSDGMLCRSEYWPDLWTMNYSLDYDQVNRKVGIVAREMSYFFEEASQGTAGIRQESLSFPLDVESHPWLHILDTVSEGGEKQGDGKISEVDVNAWAKSRISISAVADLFLKQNKEYKQKFFAIATAAREVMYKLSLATLRLNRKEEKDLLLLAGDRILRGARLKVITALEGREKHDYDSAVYKDSDPVISFNAERQIFGLGRLERAFYEFVGRSDAFQGGIGIAIEVVGNDQIIVNRVVEESPAQLAGVHVKDKIIGFRDEQAGHGNILMSDILNSKQCPKDKEDRANCILDTVADVVKGPLRSKVELTVYRMVDGVGKMFQISISRNDLKLPSFLKHYDTTIAFEVVEQE